MALEEAEILSLLSAHPLFERLDLGTLTSLARASRFVSYRARRTVLSEGEASKYAFSLLRGGVRVFHRSGKAEVLLKLFRAPAFFGEMEVLAQRPFMEYVQTLEPSDLLLIPANVFRNLVKNNGAFSTGLALDLAARLCISAHNQKALAFCDVGTRLASLFLDYVEFYGQRIGGHTRISVPLSQDSLARDLGVTRRALGISLARLRKQGVVSKSQARFNILDEGALRREAMGDVRLSYRIRG